ncbi:hypothetical protein CDN99_25635 [Roseateles aquatilis]|uniref:Uncharacterized protein n=1 Tax=Roseateles aquatilis TaxID=431061 RepID=A0A246IUG0_9BURK|nr:phage coat protein [Roseateles aquatilis]OWQ83850.1 hypothetical protein CDN99_25635 [Roseateles aquatilis]
MAVCAVQGPGGVELTPLPPGAPCAGIVLLQPDDVPPNPLVLTYEQGALVSAAVMGVWLCAWGFRALYSVLNTNSDD